MAFLLTFCSCSDTFQKDEITPVEVVDENQMPETGKHKEVLQLKFATPDAYVPYGATLPLNTTTGRWKWIGNIFRALDNNSKDIYLLQGLAYVGLGEQDPDYGYFEKGIADFNTYTRMSGTDKQYLPVRAIAYFRAGEPESKLDYFKKSVEDVSKFLEKGGANTDIYLARGSSCFYLGEAAREEDKPYRELYKRAVHDLDLYLQLGGTFSDAYMRRGFSCYYLGKKDKARDDLNKRLHVVRESRIYKEYEIMGQIHVINDDYKRALKMNNYGVKTFPDSFVPYFRRAEIHFKQGDLKQARADLQNALAKKIDNSGEKEKILKLMREIDQKISKAHLKKCIFTQL